MSTGRKQLAQSRPSGTGAASIYSPASNIEAEIQTIFIANTTGSTAYFSLYLDDDGTTYDETTALYWQVDIVTKAVKEINFPEGSGIFMDNSNGNLAFLTETGNALTITVFGMEVVE